MKYILTINEDSKKGQAAIAALTTLGVPFEKMKTEKLASEKLGLPGYKVSQEQMREWLDDSEKGNDIDFHSLINS